MEKAPNQWSKQNNQDEQQEQEQSPQQELDKPLEEQVLEAAEAAREQGFLVDLLDQVDQGVAERVSLILVAMAQSILAAEPEAVGSPNQMDITVVLAVRVL